MSSHHISQNDWKLDFVKKEVTSIWIKNKLELLQEYCLIAFDVFHDFPYPKDRSEQTAWLSLLATESVEEADKLIKEYPWLEEIYREVAALRQNPEEVLWMYSEALRIMDRNTVGYMIEQQQKEIEQQKQELKKKDIAMQKVIQEKDIAIQKMAQEKDLIIQEKNSSLEQKEKELVELKQQLEQLRQKKEG